VIDPNVFVYLSISIIVLWVTTLLFIKKKVIFPFLAFFIFGLTGCFRAVFILFEFYYLPVFAIIGLIYALLLIWIFIMIVRRDNGNN